MPTNEQTYIYALCERNGDIVRTSRGRAIRQMLPDNALHLNDALRCSIPDNGRRWRRMEID